MEQLHLKFRKDMQMDTHEPVGNTGTTRREAILMLGATLIAGPAAAQFPPPKPACVLTPEQTEGPYFSEHALERSDIRRDPSDGSVVHGVPFALSLRTFAVGKSGCAPLPGAIVDVWHCDAAGFYSDVADPRRDTRGKKFLRGYQATDADGVARFLTIYPGWYPGRAVHIHFKVRTKSATGHDAEITSQLYFPDVLSDAILSRAPYPRTSARRTRNEDDGIFRRDGRDLMLAPEKQGSGLAAVFDVGLKY